MKETSITKLKGAMMKDLARTGTRVKEWAYKNKEYGKTQKTKRNRQNTDSGAGGGGMHFRKEHG